MSLRLLTLFALVLACKPSGRLEGETREAASELPPAPAPPHAIEILMAGKPPHEALRFHVDASSEQRAFVKRHYSKYGASPTGLVNTSDAWTVVAQVDPGEHAGSFTGTFGTLLEEVDEFSPLARVEVGPRGPIGAFEPLREEPHWLPDLLERFITGFPADAVGEGAVWQTLVSDALGSGNDLRIVYELVEIERGAWHLKGESSVLSSAAKPSGKAATPKEGRPDVVHSEFDVWWRPSEPLPHSGRIKEQRTVFVPGGSEVEVIELVFGEAAPEREDTKGGW